jgi:transposase
LTTKECYNYYIKKDPVEKSFHNYKAYLGLDSPYVHGSKRMINKTFVIFIAKIIFCAIHKVMYDADFFKKMTISEILSGLKKIKLYKVGNISYLKPVTKKQKEIFKLFNIDIPSITKYQNNLI